MLFIFLSGLDLIGFGLIGSFFSLIIDGSINNSNPIVQSLLVMGTDSIHQIALLLILIYFIKGLLSFLINKNILLFSNLSAYELRKKLVHNYQIQSFSDYLKSNSSKYIQSVTEYSYSYNVCLVGLLRLFSDIILITAIIIFFIYYFGKNIIYIFFVLSIGLVLYDKIFKSVIHNFGKKANESNKAFIKSISELIKGYREIRIYGKENYFNKLFDKYSLNYGIYRSKSQIISIIPRYIIEFSSISLIVVLALLTSLSSNLVGFSISDLSIVAVATFRILPSFITISTNISQIRTNKHTFEKLIDYLNSSKTSMPIKQISNTSINNKLQMINIENVSFGFDGNLIFKNLNLKIKMGEKLLLKGPSGSGKTTFINLITGFHEPDSGKIIVNGDATLKSEIILKQNTAYIPQQAFIIDDSIKNNIAFGLKENEINKSKLNNSVDKACLDEYVNSLANGKNTIIGEDGARISGGQKQRIALARAFYFDKSVIVLDESTNSLDKNTEKTILSEILENSSGKLVILISHNDHNDIEFDRHLIIKDKSIVEVSK
jgi:ATP-binding cassette, subfamily B, bacterial PglK